MKKLLFAVATLFCAAVLWILIEVVRRAFEEKGSPSHLRRIAAQINLREREDESTEVTATVYSDNSLGLRYKRLDVDAAEFDAAERRKMREMLRDRSCTNDELRELLDKNVTLRYALVDRNGTAIVDTEILRWECGV